MNLKTFSVYDQAAKAYLQPFFASSAGLALRMFAEAANTPDHNFNRYAADYTLFELGEFDQQDCKFTLHSVPENLGSALHHINNTPPFDESPSDGSPAHPGDTK